MPGRPHHVTQRGKRRRQTLFCDEDYAECKRLMAQWCAEHRVAARAYCLMPNHVHLVAVPQSADGLRLAIGEAHHRCTRRVNFREGWRGHLWRGRFDSFVMDRVRLGAAVRYVERNPVRAALVRRGENWPWSSAAAHLAGADDGLVSVGPMLRMVGDWRRYLRGPDDEEVLPTLRRNERTRNESGQARRPLGDARFLARLEAFLARALRPQRPGPRPKGRRN